MLGDAPAHKIAYTVEEAAALTGLGRTTLYSLIGTRQLRSAKVGGRRLIPHTALVQLIEEAADV